MSRIYYRPGIFSIVIQAKSKGKKKKVYGTASFLRSTRLGSLKLSKADVAETELKICIRNRHRLYIQFFPINLLLLHRSKHTSTASNRIA